MPISYFFFGFFTGLLFVLVLMGLMVLYVKRSRNRKPAVIGYLDLIPDLSERQRELVQEIRRVFLPKVEGIRRDMRSRRAELAELLFAEPTDRARIFEVSQQIIGYQSELEKEVLEHILEEKEILSLPQKRKFYEIIVEEFASGGLGVHDVRSEKKEKSIP
jgi:Heavy-metal resistance